MDARSIAQRIVAIFLVGAGFCFPAFADPAPIIYSYSQDFNLPIPSPDDPDSKYGRGWMTDAIIEVPDHFTICDLDVGISLTHTSAFDLQIFLQSPTGGWICLNMYDFEKEFFEGQDYTNTIFDDQAEISIEDANAPFTGRFRPRSPFQLSVFNDQNTFGQWKLQIYDAYYNDIGTFNHLELIFTIPEPTTVILLILGAGLAVLTRGRCSR